MKPAVQFVDTTENRYELQRLWLRRLAAPVPPVRAVVVAAHPDDEIIGAGARLMHLRRHLLVVHVTDGAPRDLADARHAGFASAQEYAEARRRELHAALALAGIEEESAMCLGIPDQRAAFSMALLAPALATLFAAVQPDIVLTHPFEGGHPDHDATAYAVHRAVALARRRGADPTIVEFTSYHAGPGGLQPGVFLPSDEAVPSVAVPLDGRDREIKAAMFRCFVSQAATLQYFAIADERFRIAPAYRFGLRPHEGRLWYERYAWAPSWPTWARLVEEADEALGATAGAA